MLLSRTLRQDLNSFIQLILHLPGPQRAPRAALHVLQVEGLPLGLGRGQGAHVHHLNLLLVLTGTPLGLVGHHGDGEWLVPEVGRLRGLGRSLLRDCSRSWAPPWRCRCT